jgi:hypothetical protein
MRDVLRAVICAAVLAIVVRGGALGAQPAGVDSPRPSEPEHKQPWEWTIEERLAARLDPVNIAERHEVEEIKDRAAGIVRRARANAGPHRHSIDGDRNPELLLPHELFDNLVTGLASGELRRRKRESLRAGILASGFDEELFWSQLYSAASEYVDEYAYPRSDGAVVREDRGRCRASFTALTNARQIFGQDRFDRFLYEVVAPRIRLAWATTAEDPATELRFVTGGCQ